MLSCHRNAAVSLEEWKWGSQDWTKAWRQTFLSLAAPGARKPQALASCHHFYSLPCPVLPHSSPSSDLQLSSWERLPERAFLGYSRRDSLVPRIQDIIILIALLGTYEVPGIMLSISNALSHLFLGQRTKGRTAPAPFPQVKNKLRGVYLAQSLIANGWCIWNSIWIWLFPELRCTEATWFCLMMQGTFIFIFILFN